MALLLLFVMLTACAATPQDLSGKRFVFPETSITTYVILTPSTTSLDDATVCLRFVTDLTRAHGIFSLSTSTIPDAFLIFKSGTTDEIELRIDDVTQTFHLDYELNVWHSMCATWDKTSGLVQLWFDGKPSVKKYTGGSTLSIDTIVLGQDQDSTGGGFEDSQSFVGILSDVHMWNSVLSTCEIKCYVNDFNFTPGNVLNWKALEYVIMGRVTLENKPLRCH